MKKTTEDISLDIVNYTILTLIILITLYPFYYLLITSFNKGAGQVFGVDYFLPSNFTMENYQYFFSDNKWMTALFVTVLRTLTGTLLQVLFTCIVAYGLSYKKLIFKKFYMTLMIIAMYFSGGLIPFYVVLRGLSLLNTFWVYIVPNLLSIFFSLIAISFFSDISEELTNAARIDGANEFTIFLRIIIPVSKPLLATMVLFLGVGHWNSWLDSSYFVSDNHLRTLTYRMIEIINQSTIQSNTNIELAGKASKVTPFSLQVTAMIVSVVPILSVYPFLQKYFIQGMMLGSVKE